MHTKLIRIKDGFIKNSESVKELMNFDRIILDFSISKLDELNVKLKALDINNPQLLVDFTLQALRGIREHDSLRQKYESIYNQCLVLLVSHYTLTMEDIFKCGVNILISENKFKMNNSDDSIKISISELRSLNFDLSGNFGELLLNKKDISFQDMQSLNRAYSQYLDISLPIDKNLNNIIFAQAARHSIVHSSAHADDKFINQIRNLNPRDLKVSIKKKDVINMTPEEILIIDESMRETLDYCINQIKAATNTTQSTPT
jgi:hypothetical protein